MLLKIKLSSVICHDLEQKHDGVLIQTRARFALNAAAFLKNACMKFRQSLGGCWQNGYICSN